MHVVTPPLLEAMYAAASGDFEQYKIVKDLIDECIDPTLNYRQSGHPGGTRSKVHLFLATLLSGVMNWDLRRPCRPFQDPFLLSAGHTVPLVSRPKCPVEHGEGGV